ncbi:hypothetical protein GJ496_008425 [Pomphorhynchus laevis]|nr:hypothetical protein GJ496_008425 [Pomphorhynchus laevis]
MQHLGLNIFCDFDTIETTHRHLKLFEKTCCDSEFANIYALFCSHISKVVRTSPVSVNNFLYRVVRRFQTEFEHRAYKENKQKTLTAILFLAKLFHVYVLNETVAHMCLKRLLRTKECQQYPLEKKLEFIEADLTYFCKIMELIGERLDQPNTGQFEERHVKTVDGWRVISKQFRDRKDDVWDNR